MDGSQLVKSVKSVILVKFTKSSKLGAGGVLGRDRRWGSEKCEAGPE